MDNEILDELLRAINKSIQEIDIRELKTEWFARKAGLDYYYNTAYSLFSGTVHANVRDLEECVEVNDKNEIISFKYGPDVKGINELLLMAAESTIILLRHVVELFELSTANQVNCFYDRLRKLMAG